MSRRSCLAQLADAAPHVLPSLLLCDFGNLEREVSRLEQAGVGALHLDVMDGNFVPNLTYGMPVVQSLRRLTKLPLDVHLMIAQPERYLEPFYEAGADILTIHIEAVDDPRPALQMIHRLGAGVGVALNPHTPLALIEDSLDLCDLLLVMSVRAGFGGQQFNPVALDKLREARQLAGPDILLEVDGGVNPSTIGECARAGAQLLVVGSAIFGQPDYGAMVSDLSSLARAESLSRKST